MLVKPVEKLKLMNCYICHQNQLTDAENEQIYFFCTTVVILEIYLEFKNAYKNVFLTLLLKCLSKPKWNAFKFML